MIKSLISRQSFSVGVIFVVQVTDIIPVSSISRCRVSLQPYNVIWTTPIPIPLIVFYSTYFTPLDMPLKSRFSSLRDSSRNILRLSSGGSSSRNWCIVMYYSTQFKLNNFQMMSANPKSIWPFFMVWVWFFNHFYPGSVFFYFKNDYSIVKDIHV